MQFEKKSSNLTVVYCCIEMLKWKRTKERAKKVCVHRSCYVICKGLAAEIEKHG